MEHVEGVSMMLLTALMGLQALLVHSQRAWCMDGILVTHLAMSVIYLTFLVNKLATGIKFGGCSTNRRVG